MPEQLIEILSFNTGVPFGYFLYFSFILICTLYVTIQFFKFLVPKWRKSANLLIGGILAIFVTLSVYANIELNNYEWNNHSVVEADLIGKWKDNGSILILNKGGTFDASFNNNHSDRIGFSKAKGAWSVNNSSIVFSLKSKKVTVPLRVTKFRNAYRLIIEDFSDPDMWDGKLGFKKQ